MAEGKESNVLALPRVYLVRMLVFVVLVAIVATVLYPQFRHAFMANPGLNGLIIFTLVLGLAYAFRMVWRLFPEVNWINHFRIADPGLEIAYTPRLLAPMATLLRDRQGATILSPLSMRSLLDSLASRLDEARDISRYLIGLLIFLGLLGTFWGLLQTVTSVGEAIKSLDVTTAESGTIFEELKAGLQAPLAGMGTSFSSSLFGLAGSLVLGFLDLQASQAQNRFYNELEEWLSSITDIAAGDGGQLSVPQYLRMDMSNVQHGIERINATLETALAEPDDAPGRGDVDSAALDKLAGAVEDLVHQMREEHRMVRQLARSQADQNAEVRRAIAGQTRPAAPTAATGRLRANVRPPRRPEG
jgi:hypothetical protein